MFSVKHQHESAIGVHVCPSLLFAVSRAARAIFRKADLVMAARDPQWCDASTAHGLPIGVPSLGQCAWLLGPHTHTHSLLCLDSTPHPHPILLANLLILCSTRQICGQNLGDLVVSCDWEHREHSGPQGDCPAPPPPPGFLPRFFRAGTITVLTVRGGISWLLVTVGSWSPELSAPAGYNI